MIVSSFWCKFYLSIWLEWMSQPFMTQRTNIIEYKIYYLRRTKERMNLSLEWNVNPLCFVYVHLQSLGWEPTLFLTQRIKMCLFHPTNLWTLIWAGCGRTRQSSMLGSRSRIWRYSKNKIGIVYILICRMSITIGEWNITRLLEKGKTTQDMFTRGGKQRKKEKNNIQYTKISSP